MKKLLANDIIGKVTPPKFIENWGPFPGAGPVNFLNAILRLIFLAAGLYAFFNLIIAGFQFITAGGDPKGIENAWNKIWQSLLGLIILVSSFVLAAVFGWLLFGDPTAILKPKIQPAP